MNTDARTMRSVPTHDIADCRLPIADCQLPIAAGGLMNSIRDHSIDTANDEPGKHKIDNRQLAIGNVMSGTDFIFLIR
jgi:hypothetical protein